MPPLQDGINSAIHLSRLSMLLPLCAAVFVSQASPIPTVTYRDVKPYLDEHCVPCHSNVIDLRELPFKGMRTASGTLKEEVEQCISRMRGEGGKQLMPPPYAPKYAMPEGAIELFEAWLAAGLPK